MDKKTNKRAEITPNFQAKRLMLKVPAVRALAACERVDFVSGLRDDGSFFNA